MPYTHYMQHGGDLRPPRPLLFAPILVAMVGGLLLGRGMLPPAAAGEGPQAGPSESPSDRPPSAAEAEPSVKETCRPMPCTTRPVRCRRRLPRPRLMGRRGRRRCCCCQPPAAPKPDPYAWQDLFDGKTLEGWKTPQFGGEGEVHVEDGVIVLEMGSTMTGITWTGEPPRTNYELEWEGARLDGIDFFATATFPVGEKCVSFVTGGWAGMVAGISCVDYYDASDNLTTTFQEFKDKQWYKFRVRVTDAKIQVWIDQEQVVDLPRKGHEFDIRDEVDLCRPLGISAWCTKGGVRNIRIRRLRPSEVEAAAAEADVPQAQ